MVQKSVPGLLARSPGSQATSNPKTFRRLAIVWGVEPFLTQRSFLNSDEAIYHFFSQAIRQGFLDLSHPFVVTIGRHSDKTGSTNVVQLVDNDCLRELERIFDKNYS